ncbi:MAG: LacI family transcriptional regulator [Fimbriimonadaceae bacterium]|jgi:DNA-binding LacI/PurR family transcriptional regulator|nr:LacI family transcriptional regulator [Fimbriimonadaceae bacterium]
MKTRISLNEVAKAAGVHPATVSHVLNGRASARISRSTQERVRLVAANLGYTPNRAARTLATGKSQIIALQTFDLRSAFSAEIASRLQQLLLQDGFDLMVMLVDRDLKDVTSTVDGVIALDYNPRTDLSHIPCPYVAIGVYYPEDRDSVVFDLLTAARESMAYLLKAGRKRIAYLTDSDLIHASDPREEAYVMAIQSAGLEPEVIVVPSRSRILGAQGFVTHVQQFGWPEAVTCRNDELALWVMVEARKAGVRVPQDLAIVGSDGIAEGEYCTPQVSTLVAPFDQLCQAAWDLLKQRLANPDGEPIHRAFTARFEERGSSLTLPEFINEENHEK